MYFTFSTKIYRNKYEQIKVTYQILYSSTAAKMLKVLFRRSRTWLQPVLHFSTIAGLLYNG